MESRTEGSNLIEKVVKISRVAKVVKGGRRFSFSAMVVVGDGKSRVGYALGKANEVTEAIRKGVEQAQKNMRKVVIAGRTIPHAATGCYCSSEVVMKPCAPGKGIIAAGAVRSVMEAVGIHDVSAKTLGSHNPHNVLKASLSALYSLCSFEQIASQRGVPVEKLRGRN